MSRPPAISAYAQLQTAFDVPKCMQELIQNVITEHERSPCDLTTYSDFETRHRMQLNVLLRDSTLTAQRKRLAKLTLKACLVVLAFRDYETNDPSFLYSESEMLTQYPELCNSTELAVLARFRNMIAVSLTLMAALNNKSKHLTIATRLSEGKKARYVTGSGQKAATNRRVFILRRESSRICPTVATTTETAATVATQATTALTNSGTHVASAVAVTQVDYEQTDLDNVPIHPGMFDILPPLHANASPPGSDDLSLLMEDMESPLH